MSRVYFISDLHFGHRNILNFSGDKRPGTTIDEHDAALVERWNSRVTHRDLTWVLGDVSFDRNRTHLLYQLNGRKRLVRGNHDDLHTTKEWLEYFEEVYGLVKYKGLWLSHCPIHPIELRGRPNVHGHVHDNAIPDPRYFSVCVEALNGYPISHDELRERLTCKSSPD